MYVKRINLQTEICRWELDDILKTLTRFSNLDYNGENWDDGEHLWDCAREGGFKSNEEWRIAEIRRLYSKSDIESKREVVQAIVEEFINDNYDDTEYEVQVDFTQGMVIISLAWYNPY